jgi:voltage-gated potassium channel
VVVTTHDDDTNVYLTLYSRKLRPRAEILGRVELDRNVTTMHRAGADFVLSYATMGAIEAWNAWRDDSTLLLAEGWWCSGSTCPRRSRAAAAVDGHPGDHRLHGDRHRARRVCFADPGPDEPLPADAELLLIGDDQAEERFYARYVNDRRRTGGWFRRLTRRG